MTKAFRRTAAIALIAFAASAGRVSPAPVYSPPSTYHVSLHVSDSLAEIQGSLSLRYVNLERPSLDRLQFFLFPNLTAGRMEVSRCSVGGVPSRFEYRMRDSVLVVPLARPIVQGATVDVEVEYAVSVPEETNGDYGAFSRSDRAVRLAWCCPVVLSPRSWANPYPVPYADFLCKEPSLYKVRVSLPSGLTLIFPGKQTSSATRGGRRVIEFEHGPARELFMAAGRGMVSATAEADGVAVRCFAPPGRAEAAALAADSAAKALEVFGRRFGPYPYESLTIVASPLASFGLEFSGIFAITERIFDLDATMDAMPARILLEATVAHETAHQWFYGIVGNDQAQEPWLDEAIAQYATWLYYRDRYGVSAASGFFRSFGERWDRVGRKPIPIGLSIWEYNERQYGAIVYGRGPLFLHALSERMGEAAFDVLLRDWVKRFEWRIASGADFRALAEEECRCDLEGFFDLWVWGRHRQLPSPGGVARSAMASSPP
jgi:hypothetical protein